MTPPRQCMLHHDATSPVRRKCTVSSSKRRWGTTIHVGELMFHARQSLLTFCAPLPLQPSQTLGTAIEPICVMRQLACGLSRVLRLCIHMTCVGILSMPLPRSSGRDGEALVCCPYVPCSNFFAFVLSGKGTKESPRKRPRRPTSSEFLVSMMTRPEYFISWSAAWDLFLSLR